MFYAARVPRGNDVRAFFLYSYPKAYPGHPVLLLLLYCASRGTPTYFQPVGCKKKNVRNPFAAGYKKLPGTWYILIL